MPIVSTVTVLDRWTLKPVAVLRFGIPVFSQAVVSTITAPVSPLASTILLDLSSNDDQFGVHVSTGNKLADVAALDVTAPAVPQKQLAVYTLPGISWESVVDQSTND